MGVTILNKDEFSETVLAGIGFRISFDGGKGKGVAYSVQSAVERETVSSR